MSSPKKQYAEPEMTAFGSVENVTLGSGPGDVDGEGECFHSH